VTNAGVSQSDSRVLCALSCWKMKGSPTHLRTAAVTFYKS